MSRPLGAVAPARIADIAIRGDFDRAGRLRRAAERRSEEGYGGPAKPPAAVDPEVAVGKQRQPWGDVGTWIRQQANVRLKGMPNVGQWRETARAFHAVADWIDDNAQTMHDQLAQAGKGYSTTSRAQEGARGATGGVPMTGVEAAVLGSVADTDDEDHPSDRQLARPDVDDQLVVMATALFRSASVAVGCQRRLGSGMARRAEERAYSDDTAPLGDCPGLADDNECTCRADVGGAGHCMACGQWCSGARGDVIVGGLCQKACYSARRRWLEAHPEDPDRAAFVRDRRAWLAEQVAAAAAVHEDELADRRDRRSREKGRRRAA